MTSIAPRASRSASGMRPLKTHSPLPEHVASQLFRPGGWGRGRYRSLTSSGRRKQQGSFDSPVESSPLTPTPRSKVGRGGNQQGHGGAETCRYVGRPVTSWDSILLFRGHGLNASASGTGRAANLPSGSTEDVRTVQLEALRLHEGVQFHVDESAREAPGDVEHGAVESVGLDLNCGMNRVRGSPSGDRAVPMS